MHAQDYEIKTACTWLDIKVSQNNDRLFWQKIGTKFGRFRPIRADSRLELTMIKIGRFKWGETGRGVWGGRGQGG